jgi:hypothetical protein
VHEASHEEQQDPIARCPGCARTPLVGKRSLPRFVKMLDTERGEEANSEPRAVHSGGPGRLSRDTAKQDRSDRINSAILKLSCNSRLVPCFPCRGKQETGRNRRKRGDRTVDTARHGNGFPHIPRLPRGSLEASETQTGRVMSSRVESTGKLVPYKARHVQRRGSSLPGKHMIQQATRGTGPCLSRSTVQSGEQGKQGEQRKARRAKESKDRKDSNAAGNGSASQGRESSGQTVRNGWKYTRKSRPNHILAVPRPFQVSRGKARKAMTATKETIALLHAGPHGSACSKRHDDTCCGA